MAWVAGAIFAVHPVHAQSVAWISELKNTLSAFFGLLAACVFVDWLGVGDREGPSSRLRYALGMALYLAALAAKTATCVLPAALLLVTWWKRGRVQKRDLAVIVPLAALGAAFVTLTVTLEAGHGGAEGAGFGLSFFERLLVAGRSLWFYAGKLLWPAGLSFIYPRWTIDLATWWQWLFPLAAAAALATLVALRSRIGRGPATAVGYFAVAVVPVSMVNVSYHAQSFVADHWQYFASIGLIALVPCVFARLPSRAQVTAGALVLVLGALTWQRAHVYASAQELWADTLQRNPQAWAAHSNMGVLLLEEGRVEPAKAHFREAIRIRPETAGAHDNLGRALAQTGRLEEAVTHLAEAVRLRPGFAPYEMHLGIALGMKGRHDEAVAHLRAAVESDPHYAPARHNLERALLAREKVSSAEPE
jgi:Flp pilus assembly protein TadD